MYTRPYCVLYTHPRAQFCFAIEIGDGATFEPRDLCQLQSIIKRWVLPFSHCSSPLFGSCTVMYSFHSHDTGAALPLCSGVCVFNFSSFHSCQLAHAMTLRCMCVCVCADNIEGTYLNKNFVKHFVCWGMGIPQPFHVLHSKRESEENRKFIVRCSLHFSRSDGVGFDFVSISVLLQLVRIWSHQKQLSLQSFSLRLFFSFYIKLLFFLFILFGFLCKLVLAVVCFVAFV